MKKIAAILLALCWMLAACACALTGSGYPAWSGSAAPENSLCAWFDSDMIQLEFDSAPEYSYIQDGLITACFFAFDAAQQNYLEMYIMLPESAASGDVYSSADRRGDSSISLYEVFKDGEDLYFAGQLAGNVYPSGSDYEITIDSVGRENGCLNVQGRLHATLQRIVSYVPADEILTLKDASFRFSLPLQGDVLPKQSAAPEATQQPFTAPKESQQPAETPRVSQFPLPEATPKVKAPAYTMDPHPAFTLPPDYRVI